MNGLSVNASDPRVYGAQASVRFKCRHVMI